MPATGFSLAPSVQLRISLEYWLTLYRSLVYCISMVLYHCGTMLVLVRQARLSCLLTSAQSSPLRVIIQRHIPRWTWIQLLSGDLSWLNLLILSPAASPIRDDSKLAYKDAMFFSMHKFIGGVDSPGVLVAKRAMFHNSVPDQCGGGTVFFVSQDSTIGTRSLLWFLNRSLPAIIATFSP